MKIAIPYDNGQVNPHFGKSREFIIFETDGGKITGKKIVSTQDLCHNHDGLAGLLKDEGVKVVITGGIGNSMVVALQHLGFTIVTGASGDASTVAEDYANGKLVTKDVEICGCGGGEHEQHGC